MWYILLIVESTEAGGFPTSCVVTSQWKQAFIQRWLLRWTGMYAWYRLRWCCLVPKSAYVWQLSYDCTCLFECMQTWIYTYIVACLRRICIDVCRVVYLFLCVCMYIACIHFYQSKSTNGYVDIDTTAVSQVAKNSKCCTCEVATP